MEPTVFASLGSTRLRLMRTVVLTVVIHQHLDTRKPTTKYPPPPLPSATDYGFPPRAALSLLLFGVTLSGPGGAGVHSGASVVGSGRGRTARGLPSSASDLYVCHHRPVNGYSFPDFHRRTVSAPEVMVG